MAEDNNLETKKTLQGAYNITENSEGKEYWNSIGVAVKHADGKGANVKLHSMPVNGEFTLRDLREQKMQQYSEQEPQRQSAQAQEVNQGYEPE